MVCGSAWRLQPRPARSVRPACHAHSARHQGLRRRHPAVTGSHDEVDRLESVDAIDQGADGMRAAHRTAPASATQAAPSMRSSLDGVAT